MCGRFALAIDDDDLYEGVQDVGLPVQNWVNRDGYRVNYNVAPQNRSPVVRRAAPRGDDEEQGDALILETMKWGLVPHWTKRAPDYGSMLKTINARDDTVLGTGGMWASIKGRKRCIVVVQGFYEWLKKGKDKIPHFTKRKDGKLMCLAGLWDSVTYEGEETSLHTFTIITTSSNKQLSFLHDRMPVILDPKDFATWLDTSSQQFTSEVAKLLKPFEGELECYPVPKEVGKVGNQSPDFIKPVEQRKGNISSFFAKQAASSPSKPTSTPPKPSPAKGKAKAEDVEAKVTAQEVGTADDEVVEINPDEVPSKPSPSSGKKRSKPEGKEEDTKPSTKKAKKASSSPPPTSTKPASSPTKSKSPASKGKASPTKKKAEPLEAGQRSLTDFVK